MCFSKSPSSTVFLNTWWLSSMRWFGDPGFSMARVPLLLWAYCCLCKWGDSMMKNSCLFKGFSPWKHLSFLFTFYWLELSPWLVRNSREGGEMWPCWVLRMEEKQIQGTSQHPCHRDPPGQVCKWLVSKTHWPGHYISFGQHGACRIFKMIANIRRSGDSM